MYWTLGSHDLVAIVSAAEGVDVAAVLLQLAVAVNLRAFDEAEFATIRIAGIVSSLSCRASSHITAAIMYGARLSWPAACFRFAALLTGMFGQKTTHGVPL